MKKNRHKPPGISKTTDPERPGRSQDQAMIRLNGRAGLGPDRRSDRSRCPLCYYLSYNRNILLYSILSTVLHLLNVLLWFERKAMNFEKYC